jgi:hypothetical protein
MDGFDWILWAAGVAGITARLCALAALSRRKTRRRTDREALAAISNSKRRIDVVAIDEGTVSARKRERPDLNKGFHHG